MLVIHGDVDGALQVENAETVANALPPGSRVAIIPGAGHFSELDQPAAVCDAILDYLNHDSG